MYAIIYIYTAPCKELSDTCRYEEACGCIPLSCPCGDYDCINNSKLCVCVFVFVCVYIYIYMFLCMYGCRAHVEIMIVLTAVSYIYIYIYIYIC